MIGEESIAEFSIAGIEDVEYDVLPVSAVVLQCEFDVEPTTNCRMTIQPRYDAVMTLDPSP